MNQNSILILIIVISLAIFIISLLKNQPEILFKVVLRCAIGAVLISVINVLLAKISFAIPVGVNGVTVGVSGLLGIPGLILLYSIAFYQMLS